MLSEKFWDELFDIIAAGLDANKQINNEEKAEFEKAAESFSKRKKYTKGTVVDAMAERGWSRFDMRRVLEEVTDSERAEAAVGLIRSGKYDAYDIRRILEDF